MRRVLALATAVAALAWVGCGGSDDATTTADDQQQVSGAVTGYFSAEAKGDFQGACDYLTAGRQAEMVKGAQVLRPKSEALQVQSCPEALSFIFRTPGLHELVANLQGVSGVTVSGSSAKASANSTTAKGVNTTTRYLLARTSGGWKIEVGSGATSPPRATVAPP